MGSSRRHAPSTLLLYGLLGFIAFVAVILLLAPTVVVIVVSFTSGYSLKFPPPSYSLRWYASLVDAWQLQYAAWNSLKVGVASTLLSVLMGVSAALAWVDDGGAFRAIGARFSRMSMVNATSAA